VPSTPEPRKIPTSQITREPVEIVRDFQIAHALNLNLFAERPSQNGAVDLYSSVRVVGHAMNLNWFYS
jgi:hypothetical protein